MRMMPNKHKVLRLLSDGKGYSVLGIMKALFITDPRSTIRDLRKEGYNITDIWCKTDDGKRYKRYYYRPMNF